MTAFLVPKLYKATAEMKVPRKLTRLVKITKSEIASVVRVQSGTSSEESAKEVFFLPSYLI